MPNGKSSARSNGKQPNILVIFGEDIGITNLSAHSFGMMGGFFESL
jgi:hypothetical protein